MTINIVVIGDELLIGQVTDTNTGEIARQIAPYGWEVGTVTVCHDDAAAIRRAIERAMEDAPLVITTGGLGPTKDDITKQTLCDIFGGRLVHDPAVTENIARVMGERHLPVNDLTASQALVPDTCRVIQNEVGTAPIMWFERSGHILVAMPGVPFETATMLRRAVVPALVERLGADGYVERRTAIVVGLPESAIAERLAPWEEILPPTLHLAYLPQAGIVRLRLDAHAPGIVDAAFTDMLHLLGKYVIAVDDLTPAEILLQELRRRHMTLAVAESCTGGNIAHHVTLIPGASEVLRGGIVAYHNDVKTALLGVDAADIAQHGAVSEPVAVQMAVGARRALQADIAIATSGIAGPGGGSPQKPVGTVCIAIATDEGVQVRTYHLSGPRQRIIERATNTALIDAVTALR